MVERLAQIPLEPPKLIAITDVTTHGFETSRSALVRVCAAARPGSVMVQCRDRQLRGRERLEWARELRALTATHGQLLFVNDRVDIALICDADGVHLGERSMHPEDVVRCGDEAARLHVSAAWHSARSAPPAAQCLLVSPVMAERKGAPPLGVAGLREFIQRADGRWVYALGGIEATHVQQLLGAGATGVAAIGAVIRDSATLLAELAIER